MGVNVYCGEILMAFIKLLLSITFEDSFVSCRVVMRRLYHSECGFFCRSRRLRNRRTLAADIS